MPPKTADRLEKEIRTIARLPANKQCVDCPEKLPTYANLTHNTFVCTKCSGIHREFQFKIKGISMSVFSEDEVRALKLGGNERNNSKFLARYNPREFHPPNPQDVSAMREFIKMKYLDRRWYSDTGGSTTSRERSPSVESETKETKSDTSSTQRPSLTALPEEKPLSSVLPGVQGVEIRSAKSSAGQDLLDLMTEPVPVVSPAPTGNGFAGPAAATNGFGGPSNGFGFTQPTAGFGGPTATGAFGFGGGPAPSGGFDAFGSPAPAASFGFSPAPGAGVFGGSAPPGNAFGGPAAAAGPGGAFGGGFGGPAPSAACFGGLAPGPTGTAAWPGAPPTQGTPFAPLGPTAAPAKTVPAPTPAPAPGPMGGGDKFSAFDSIPPPAVPIHASGGANPFDNPGAGPGNPFGAPATAAAPRPDIRPGMQVLYADASTNQYYPAQVSKVHFEGGHPPFVTLRFPTGQERQTELSRVVVNPAAPPTAAATPQPDPFGALGSAAWNGVRGAPPAARGPDLFTAGSMPQASYPPPAQPRSQNPFDMF